MISLILGLALVGLVLYLIERFIPMDPVIVIVLRVVVVVLIVLYLARVFGVGDLPLPRIR